MPYLRRLVLVASLVTVLLGLSVPVIALDGIVLATAESDQAPADTTLAPGEEGETPTETTTAETEPVNVPEPAVVVGADDSAPPTPEWTFRFLLPTTLLLGGLAVVGTTIAYFVKVTKARYRVVE